MATATADIETKTIVKGVTLTLSGEEATAILDVFAKVGGDPWKSRRGLIDNVRVALMEAGVERQNDWRNPGDLAEQPGLYFADADEVSK